MTNKRILFFSINSVGGVAVYNRRLAEQLNRNAYKSEICYYNSSIQGISNKIKKYKFLRKFITKDSILCLTENIELETVNYYKLNNKILYFLHGDYNYYYSTAINFSSIIDSFCCVSEIIANNLLQLLPERKQDIHVIKTAINVNENIKTNNILSNIIFVGRAEKAKGFDLLPEIHKALTKNGYQVTFNLCYPEETELSLSVKSQYNTSFNYIVGLNEMELIEVYRQNHIIILPSLAEGLPLVIVEAMAMGLVPITSKIDGLKSYMKGCGYQITENNAKVYAEKIIYLLTNPALYYDFSKKCQQVIKDKFNSSVLLQTFDNLTNTETIRIKVFKYYKVFTSRLDRPYFPEYLIKYVRNIKKTLNGS